MEIPKAYTRLVPKCVPFQGEYYDRILVHGYTGTEGLLTALEMVEIGESLRDRVRQTLEAEWRDLGRLFDQGGVLGNNGSLWMGYPQVLKLDDSFVQAIAQERAITGKASRFFYPFSLSGYKSRFPGIELGYLGIDGKNVVTFLGPHFQDSLVSDGYLNYVLVNGKARSAIELERAIEHRFTASYQNSGIPPIVPAHASTEQFLREQAVKFGSGFQRVVRDEPATTMIV